MTPAEILEKLKVRFPQIEEQRFPEAAARPAEVVIVLPASELRGVLRFLKDDPDFRMDYLSMLTATDWKDRFEMLYHVISTAQGHQIMLKVSISDRAHPVVPSVIEIYSAADWQEREVFDLFGIVFEGHPNMRRLLLAEDWAGGYPMRKDYVHQVDRYD